jgi:ESCRT-II complex subunit VPS22
MARKGVGLAAFDRSRLTSAQYASHGSNLRSSQATSLSTQLSVFRSLLQQFATTHAKDIRSNASFRAEFARMCAAIGVDPLASSNAGGGVGTGSGIGNLWSQMLGGSVNDFYFELGVRVVEVCSATREENGGLIGVGEVRERIMRGRMEGGAEITEYASFPIWRLLHTDLRQGRYSSSCYLPCPTTVRLLDHESRQ